MKFTSGNPVVNGRRATHNDGTMIDAMDSPSAMAMLADSERRLAKECGRLRTENEWLRDQRSVLLDIVQTGNAEKARLREDRDRYRYVLRSSRARTLRDGERRAA